MMTGDRQPTDEVAVARVWKRVESTRERKRSARASRGTLVRGFAAGALASILVLCIYALLFQRAGTHDDAGPLAASGMIESATRTFGEGSVVTIDPGTRLELARSDGQSAMFVLGRGKATFDVVPNGPRRWTIEAGLATIEIVGTRFSVERGDDRVRIAVEHGRVLVRGELVPDRLRTLGAGEALDVILPAVVREDPPSVPVERLDAAAAAPSPTIAVPVSTAWRPLVTSGDYGAAWTALGEDGVRAETDRAADSATLLALSDVARLSGHPRGAVAPLEKLIAMYPDDPNAALAAFTLGKVEIDSLGEPAKAASAFDRCIALGPPRGIEEDAWARLVEARSRAGDGAGARTAASAYKKKFPDGARDFARWLGD